jgi:hypothetical protein
MKKRYTPPKLVYVGDMVNNTLGASGNVADSGSRSRQGGGNGSSRQNQKNRSSREKSSGLDRNNFNNDNFK